MIGQERGTVARVEARAHHENRQTGRERGRVKSMKGTAVIERRVEAERGMIIMTGTKAEIETGLIGDDGLNNKMVFCFS